MLKRLAKDNYVTLAEALMLEQPRLYLEPWRADTAGGQVRRVIRDHATGQPLGFAAWRTEFTWDWLNRWLPGRLEVFETEDASHLCSLEAPWLWRRGWRVVDAEERLIGRVWDRWLHDETGHVLGYFKGGRL